LLATAEAATLRATDGDRTRDLLDHNQVLFRLSYRRHVEPADRPARAAVPTPSVLGRGGGATRTGHPSPAVPAQV
jgi:hypothetical protein